MNILFIIKIGFKPLTDKTRFKIVDMPNQAIIQETTTPRTISKALRKKTTIE
jgi:hypothetical protein